MGWVTIAVVAIFALFTILGIKRGFISMVVGVASIAAAVLVSSALSSAVGNFLDEKTSLRTDIETKVTGYIEEQIEEAKKEAMKAAGEENISRLKSDDFKKEIEDLPLPKDVKEAITNAVGTDVSKVGHAAAVSAGKKLSDTILDGLAFIICFALIIGGIIALRIALKVTSKLPVINSMNGLMGAVAGAFEGLLVVWIFFAVITYMTGNTWAQDALGQIGDSAALSFIYDTDPIIKLI